MSQDDDPIVIPLGDNLVTWVSQEDADLQSMGWRAKADGKRRTTFYACVGSRVHGIFIETYLHNLVWERMMGASVPEGFLIDHINRDKLDNRRSNLRLATRTQNEANKKKRRGNTSSKYKGVNKMGGKRRKPWRAILTVDKKQRLLGTFETEREAAEAYNKAAVEEWGDFANINEFDD